MKGAMDASRPHPPGNEHAGDVALARRAAARDEAAWRAIYERTHNRLFALLAYHVGDRDEALELLQEVYLHALEGHPKLRRALLRAVS